MSQEASVSCNNARNKICVAAAADPQTAANLGGSVVAAAVLEAVYEDAVAKFRQGRGELNARQARVAMLSLFNAANESIVGHGKDGPSQETLAGYIAVAQVAKAAKEGRPLPPEALAARDLCLGKAKEPPPLTFGATVDPQGRQQNGGQPLITWTRQQMWAAGVPLAMQPPAPGYVLQNKGLILNGREGYEVGGDHVRVTGENEITLRLSLDPRKAKGRRPDADAMLESVVATLHEGGLQCHGAEIQPSGDGYVAEVLLHWDGVTGDEWQAPEKEEAAAPQAAPAATSAPTPAAPAAVPAPPAEAPVAPAEAPQKAQAPAPAPAAQDGTSEITPYRRHPSGVSLVQQRTASGLVFRLVDSEGRELPNPPPELTAMNNMASRWMEPGDEPIRTQSLSAIADQIMSRIQAPSAPLPAGYDAAAVDPRVGFVLGDLAPAIAFEGYNPAGMPQVGFRFPNGYGVSLLVGNGDQVGHNIAFVDWSRASAARPWTRESTPPELEDEDPEGLRDEDVLRILRRLRDLPARA